MTQLSVQQSLQHSEVIHSLISQLQLFLQNTQVANSTELSQQVDDLNESLSTANTTYRSFLQQLDKAIDSSTFVQQTLQKQPQLLLRWLNEITTTDSKNQYSENLAIALEKVNDETELHRTLRLFRHAEMATLSFRQTNNLDSVEQTFKELSALAEAIICGTYQWLYHSLCQQFGTPTDKQGNPQPMIILGMGKLGGGELNFSSDIDLIFTFPHNGETVGARRCIENSQFFIRLSQRIIQALDNQTVDGFVYRTDMRLRPFGDAGALALSFAAMEDYYQEQGRDWERYAMLKARIMGENKNDTYQQQLSKMLKPFIYRRYIDFSVIQSLRNMKEMIAREVRRRGLVDNIKLGAGGIREIEFIIQAFQLLRGGREPKLQHRSLLKILPALVETNLINEEERDKLHFAYIFLRRSENVLQAINDQQTQTLPQKESEQHILLNLCKEFRYFDQHQQLQTAQFPLKTWQDFLHLLTQQQQHVRDVFDLFIGEENETQRQHDTPSIWQGFLEHEFSEEEILFNLNQLAMDETEQRAVQHQLKIFKQDLNRKVLGQRGHQVLHKLLPRLLDKLLKLDQPNIMLAKILNIVSKISTRTTYLELLLEQPQALDMLIKLCARSNMIAEQIATYPLLLDELLDPKALFNPPKIEDYPRLLQESILRIPQEDEEQLIDTLRQFKHSSLLKVAAADILDVLPVMKVSDHLTYIAQSIIAGVIEIAWRQLSQRFGTPKYLTDNERGLMVVSYGKLGGIELGYYSDLDLVFLYDAPANAMTHGGKKEISCMQFYMKLVQKIISIFNIHTASGILYEIDIRLRPAGDAGPIISTFNAFNDYQHKDAWTWEHQSLVRARAVYGDTALCKKFNDIRHEVLTLARPLGRLQREVREMREKMYQHLASKSDEYFNIKKDAGGITDIEFIAQYLVLAHANQFPELAQWSDNVRIFEVAQKIGLLSKEDAKQLITTYTLLRNRIHHLNLIGEDATVDSETFQTEKVAINQIWQQVMTI